MTIFHGLILGIIEGLTEFLPISSTAHMILASAWLKIPVTEFLKTFEISIQLGAILAVVILYWKKIWSSWDLIFKIGTAFVTTSIIGLIFYKIVKTYLMEDMKLIASALFIGGILIIVWEKYYSKKQKMIQTDPKNIPENPDNADPISYRQATIIGACQALAMIPGVSRSAATILGGLSLGLKRKTIVEFSFLLAIPTMAAATGLDLLKSRAGLMTLSNQEIIIWLTGFIVAFLTAIIGVKFFIRFIQKNDFIAFGWYRIALGLIVFAWLFI